MQRRFCTIIGTNSSNDGHADALSLRQLLSHSVDAEWKPVGFLVTAIELRMRYRETSIDR